MFSCTCVAGASVAPADVPVVAPWFSGPEVAKIGWNTRGLVARDLDGDGRLDLALINNDRAAIELLYQRDASEPAAARSRASVSAANRWEPVLEDARFRRETLIVGQSLFDLVVADFDGDGRPDLAVAGEPVPLILRLARDDGAWEEKTHAAAPAPVRFRGGLAAADLDGDGLADLVLLGQKEIAVFLQKPGLGLVLDERIALADDNAYGLLLRDLDGDGLLDLLHLVAGQREALRVRLQVAPGKFGPELAFGLRTPRSPLVPVLGVVGKPSSSGIASAAASRARGKGKAAPVSAKASAPAADGPLFASATGGGGQIEFTRLVGGAPDDAWRGLAPRVFSPLAGARSQALYAVADLDGDGAPDIAVAFGETAQIFVYLRQPGGGFTVPRRVSSLTDARALGVLPAAGGADLLVLSGKENALATIRLGPDGAADPARALPIPGRLITFAAGELAPGRVGLAVVAEEEGKRRLTLWTREEDGRFSPGAPAVLEGLRADPRAVFLHDFDQDGRADVFVAVPGAGLRAYRHREDGKLFDLAANPLFRPGLLARPEAANAPFATDDVDGDGRPELLVSAENFVRALRLSPEGELVTVGQFETRDAGAEVTTGFVLAPSAGAKDEPWRVILHDRKANQLHLLSRPSGAATVETLDLRTVARLEVTGATRIAGPGGRREFLLLGKDRFWWMPEGGADFSVKSEGTYVSDLPDLRHTYLAAADFDGDGSTELIGVDLASNTLEVLGRDERGAWTSRMHFRVFEADPHHEGGRGRGQEPRELLVADVTGDGRPDLVLLVHDRVLVYPQE